MSKRYVVWDIEEKEGFLIPAPSPLEAAQSVLGEERVGRTIVVDGGTWRVLGPNDERVGHVYTKASWRDSFVHQEAPEVPPFEKEGRP